MYEEFADRVAHLRAVSLQSVAEIADEVVDHGANFL